MSEWMLYGIAAVVVLVVLVVLGLVLTRLYTKASKERAFVRTGAGSEKVVLNGGALVIPGLHEVVWVNMKSLRLEVRRDNEQSLITKDRMRVDAAVEFYVSVAPDTESVARAAQTLGALTLDPVMMKAQVEAKFVDALRAVAATMTMAELHEQRADFVQAVTNAVASDLAKNGLELESASLTALDQTRREYFNENNAFDAEGLTRLTRETETRRRERNEIERDTGVAIQRKNLEANEHELSIKRKQEEATLNNEREVAAMRAAQKAEVARTEADGHRLSEEARLTAQQEIALKTAQTGKNVRTAELQAEATVEIEKQATAIKIANKSQEEAAARAAADAAEAEAVKAREAVETVRATAVADRAKAIKLIQATERAEEDSIATVVAANAERQASEAEAEAARLRAQGERDAALLRAEATRALGEAEAAAIEAKNEAQNKLAPAVIRMNIQMEVIRAMPAMLQASVSPLSNIESIRIADVGGLGQGGCSGGGEGGATRGSLSDQVVDAAMRYRANAPLVDSLLSEVGLKGSDVKGLLGTALEMASEKVDAVAAAPRTAATAAAVDSGYGI